MKFNFKKIASVLTSTVMLSSTIAFAAAANFPEPFVKDGVGDYAIVVGADGTDGNAATQLDSFLKGLITETSDDSTAPISVEGESFMIADGDDKFNLGSNPSLVEDELDADTPGLSNLLADGTYENDAGDEFDYEQSLRLSSDLVVDFYQDEEDNTYIGMDLADGASVLNYTLEFDTDAEGGTGFADLEDTYITMLGKEYYVSKAQNVSGELELTLLDSANKVTLNKGELQTVTVGDKSYDVTLTYVNSQTGVKLTVDGQDTGLLNIGGKVTKKLSDGTYVTLLENLAGEDADADSAVVSLGNGEIVLNGDGSTEVQVNGEDVSDIAAYNDAVLTSTITTVGSDVSDISLAWTLGDETYLKSGDELVLPAFGTVKVVMGDFVTPKEEVTTFKNSGTKGLVIETEVTDGDYTLPILYSTNESSFTETGKDANTILWTAATAEITDLVVTEGQSFGDDYFVITRIGSDDSESYILTIDDIDEDNDNRTVFKNLVSDKKYSVDVGDDVRIGDITLTLNDAREDTKMVDISIAAGTDTATFNKLATKEGLIIDLPSTVQAESGNFTELELTLSEANGDGDLNAVPGAINITLGFSSDGAEVKSVAPEGIAEKDGSDVEITYAKTELATKVALDTAKDQQPAEVTYHGGESYAQVYVAAGDAVAAGGGSSSGSMVVTDTSSEFNAVKTKNLIVLGGTCVNKVAAKVLNVEAQYPVCGDAWETLTTVGAGKFLIKTVTSPYSADSVAMLVAGYNQADTTSAEAALEASTNVETVDGKAYTLGSGSTLTAV